MTPAGARATLLLDRGAEIPADSTAHIGAMSAVGEMIVDLVPTGAAGETGAGEAGSGDGGAVLAGGDVIGADRVVPPTSVAETVDMLEATLDSIGPDRVTSLVDEASRAVGGSGGDLSASLDALTLLSREAGADREQWASLLRRSAPLLQAQADSSPDIRQWAAAVDRTAADLAAADPQLRGVLEGAPAAAGRPSCCSRNCAPPGLCFCRTW
ncbi:hypothetical protein ACFSSF_03025 [Dietzia aerolata]|uniref:hypothetical protein n=1 Tax=Dietzia aerolata TaxID=595984 RepID=UPI003625A1BC